MRRMCPAIALVLASQAVASLSAAKEAVASDGWKRPVFLSSRGDDVQLPNLAVNVRGDAVAVWLRTSSNGVDEVVAASVRRAGGGWSRPRIISRPDVDSFPQVAVDERGNAVVAWAREAVPRRPDRIEAAVLVGGRRWRRTQALGLGQGVRVAAAGSGRMAMVWTPLGRRTAFLKVVERRRGRWRDVPPPCRRCSGSFPSVAVNAPGDVALAWGGSPDGLQVYGSYRPRGQTWEQTQPLSAADRDAINPVVGIDGQGGVIVAWSSFVGTLDVVEKPPGGGWGAPLRLAPQDHGVGNPEIGVNERGDAVILWGRGTDMGTVVESSLRPAGGQWEAPQMVAGPEVGAGFPFSVALGQRGDVAGAWGLHEGVGAAVRPAGMGWQEPRVIPWSRYGFNPVVGMDGRGTATIVWNGARVKASTYPAEPTGG